MNPLPLVDRMIFILAVFLFTASLSFSLAVPGEFGTYNGTPVANRSEVMGELNRETGQPLVELLLSEAFRPKGAIVSPNFGGHLAVAIKGTAYSVSSVYQKKTGKIVCILPIEEYLWGTQDPTGELPFGTGIGACYVRAVWGIRVYKLPARYDIRRIQAFWKWAVEEAGKDDPSIAFNFRRNNCCTITSRSLYYGGFRNYTGARHLFDFPRDAVTDFLQEILELPKDEVDWEIVRYDQVPTGKYWRSTYVPNVEWQRIWKNLPVLHGMTGNKTSLRANCAREVRMDPADPSRRLVIGEFTRESLLSRLRKIFSRKNAD